MNVGGAFVRETNIERCVLRRAKRPRGVGRTGQGTHLPPPQVIASHRGDVPVNGPQELAQHCTRFRHGTAQPSRQHMRRPGVERAPLRQGPRRRGGWETSSSQCSYYPILIRREQRCGVYRCTKNFWSPTARRQRLVALCLKRS